MGRLGKDLPDPNSFQQKSIKEKNFILAREVYVAIIIDECNIHNIIIF